METFQNLALIAAVIYFLIEPYFVGAVCGFFWGAHLGTQSYGIIGTAIGAVAGLLAGLFVGAIWDAIRGAIKWAIDLLREDAEESKKKLLARESDAKLRYDSARKQAGLDEEP